VEASVTTFFCLVVVDNKAFVDKFLNFGGGDEKGLRNADTLFVSTSIICVERNDLEANSSSFLSCINCVTEPDKSDSVASNDSNFFSITANNKFSGGLVCDDDGGTTSFPAALYPSIRSFN